MAFLEERISVSVQHGVIIEDDYNVLITKTSGDQEYRALVHPIPRRLFTVRYIDTPQNLYASVLGLYHRAYGRFAGFRAKCLDDFTTNVQIQPPTALDMTLDVLTTTTFQLVKYYGAGGTALSIGYPKRVIHKPVSGTVKIAVAGIEVTTGFTVDHTTGIITFAVAPVGTVTGGCEFDIPVRFDTAIPFRQDFGWRDTSDIKLIELLTP